MEENKKDVLPLEGEPLTTPQISEPVVNALAAALNKIETYVPTQYINDGPPDIDAEHLNHAEQAIMRVTNLANGAADAISALQSQVTQLNSDLGYYITSEDDFSHTLIGGAAQNITLNSKITLEQYTRILFLNYPGSNDGALLAIAPGDKIITAFRNNGVWEEKSSHFIATKSDLTPSFYPIPKPASINGLDNITIWEVRAFKSGKIVCLTINIDGVLSANTDWKILFTLPNEYRPSEGSVILNYITQHGKAMVMDINTGGDVRIVCPSGEGILKGDWVCRQCITYVTEA